MDRIELDNLTRTYYDAQGETFCALDHAALIWEQGHSIAIMGESGSGKSTLARLMIGLERPSEGRILINGVDTTKWGLREWRKYRGKIQAVFQDAGGTLNPSSEYIQKCGGSPCKPDRFFPITAKKTYC